MEESVFSYLKTLGYEISMDAFQSALAQAPKSVEYSKIVNYITSELGSLCGLDEQVNTIAVPEDSVSFLMEVGSLLQETGCPYSPFSQGALEDRLKTTDDKLLLLDYLISKLLAARIQQDMQSDKTIKLKVQESPEACDLQQILNTLQCPKEIVNLPVKELLDKVTLKLETIVTERGKDLIGSPIWNYQLTDQQWDEISNVEKFLHDEYTIRRRMMLQRLDCTIQSFQWSDRMKDKGDLIMKTYSDKRKQLKVEPDVDISSLLAARDDLAVIEKASSSSVQKNTQNHVYKVMIGQVPDRGGRTSEQTAPAPEMPSWQARKDGGGGRGRGGRGANRGGYNSQQQNSGGGGYRKNQQYQQQSYDSAGAYSTSYHHPCGDSGSNANYYKESQQNYGGYGNQRYDDQYQNDTKRARTFESFQNQRQTYADQYVQESQYNQQHQPRQNRGGSRGRSNYYRGGRGGGNRGQNYY